MEIQSQEITSCIKYVYMQFKTIINLLFLMINGKNGTIEIIVGKKMKSNYSAGEKFLLNGNKW